MMLDSCQTLVSNKNKWYLTGVDAVKEIGECRRKRRIGTSINGR